jgi:hypothetical protein
MNVCVSLRPAPTLLILPEDVDKSAGFPHALRMKITTKKIGGLWHGYVEGRPEIYERGLTEEIARRKAGELGVRPVLEKAIKLPDERTSEVRRRKIQRRG